MNKSVLVILFCILLSVVATSVYAAGSAPVSGVLTFTTPQRGTHTISGPTNGVYDAGNSNQSDSLSLLKVIVTDADGDLITTGVTNVILNNNNYGSQSGLWTYNPTSNEWSTTIAAGTPFSSSPYHLGINTINTTFSDLAGNNVTVSLRTNIVAQILPPVAGLLTYTTNETGTHNISSVNGVYDEGNISQTDSLSILKVVVTDGDGDLITTGVTNVSLNGVNYGSQSGLWTYDAATSEWSTTLGAGHSFSQSPYQLGVNILNTTFNDLYGNSVTLSLKTNIVAVPIISQSAVNLGTAGNFTILSETGITDVPTSAITGNIGTSPITGAAIHVSCSEVTGTIYSVDAAGPLPCRVTDATLLTTAIGDMGTAYTDVAGRAPTYATEIYSGDLSGKTLTPGVYKWSTNVNINTDVTLSGNSTDVWIFQISGNLNVASAGSLPAGIKVKLIGGAKASNVFWQVGGSTGATLGTYSTFNGNILSATQVILMTGAVLNGRALAQTQVTLDTNTVSLPTVSIADITPPVITLSSPDGVYNSTNVPVRFTVSDASGIADNCWYMIDDMIVSTPPPGSCANTTLNVSAGSHTFKLFAYDTAGNSNNISSTFVVNIDENVTSTIIDDAVSNYTVNASGNTSNIEVVITQNSSIQSITAGNDSDNKTVSVDLSLLATTSSVDKNVTITNNFTLSRDTTDTDYTVTIPSGTTVSGNTSWDGKINIPTVKLNSDYTAPSGGAIDTVIEVGSTGTQLTFSNAVKIIIAGMTGKKAAWVSGIGPMNDISTVCTSATDSSNIIGNGECYFDNGVDLIIWTKHFTSFSAYTPAAPIVAPSRSGGGGSGGIASVSPVCNAWSECVNGTMSRNCVSGSSNYILTQACALTVPVPQPSPAVNPVEQPSTNNVVNSNTPTQNTNTSQSSPNNNGITGNVVNNVPSSGQTNWTAIVAVILGVIIIVALVYVYYSRKPKA